MLTKIKYCFCLFFIFSIMYPAYPDISRAQLLQKDMFFKKYSWLNDKLYTLYRHRSIEYKVPLRFALAVIHAESEGKKIVCKNKDGSIDLGRMQVNSKHAPDDPYSLFNDQKNSEEGFDHLSKCLKKSHGNFAEAARMYNAGLHNKKEKYKNWKYVEKIIRLCYCQDIIKI